MIIMLTGGIGIGKDSITRAILEQDPEFVWLQFKSPLMHIAFLLNQHMPYQDFLRYMESRQYKDAIDTSPFTWQGQKVTPRKYLQHLAQDCLKHVLGNDVFARVIKHKAKQHKKVIISDYGFAEETFEDAFVVRLDGKERLTDNRKVFTGDITLRVTHENWEIYAKQILDSARARV